MPTFKINKEEYYTRHTGAIEDYLTYFQPELAELAYRLLKAGEKKQEGKRTFTKEVADDLLVDSREGDKKFYEYVKALYIPAVANWRNNETIAEMLKKTSEKKIEENEKKLAESEEKASR